VVAYIYQLAVQINIVISAILIIYGSSWQYTT